MIEDSCFYQTINDSFPHIGKKIKLFWGNPEFVTLMHELQHDSSGKMRAGFPAEVLLALSELETDHNMIFPHLARKDKTHWVPHMR